MRPVARAGYPIFVPGLESGAIWTDISHTMTADDHPPSQLGGPSAQKPGFAGRFLWWFTATVILAAGLVLGAAALVTAGVILTALWIYVLARGALGMRRFGQQARSGPAVLDGEYVVLNRQTGAGGSRNRPGER